MSKVTSSGKGAGKGKAVLVLVVLAFGAYLLFSDPTGSAGAVNEGKDRLDSGASSISTFLEHLELGGGQ